MLTGGIEGMVGGRTMSSLLGNSDNANHGCYSSPTRKCTTLRTRVRIDKKMPTWTHVEPYEDRKFRLATRARGSPDLKRLISNGSIFKFNNLTLRKRQSSLIWAPREEEGTWGHTPPKSDAVFTDVEGRVIATGALNRREPIGGWANGIPSQRSVPLLIGRPLKVPEVRRTVSESAVVAERTTGKMTIARIAIAKQKLNIVQDLR